MTLPALVVLETLATNVRTQLRLKSDKGVHFYGVVGRFILGAIGLDIGLHSQSLQKSPRSCRLM